MIAAICCLCVFFLLAPLSTCGGVAITNKPPLTVLMDFDAPPSQTSLTSLRHSLNLLLNPSGIDVNVQLKADLPANPEFGELVIFKMKGSCSMGQPKSRPQSKETRTLAMAYTSDGQVLHFGEVECDSVRHSLGRILGGGGSPKNQETYGTALAVVIAHELYHMLGNAVEHTREGLTKPALSATELASPKISYSRRAIATMNRSR